MLTNISARTPGVRSHWFTSPSGVVTRHDDPSSSEFIIRNVSGYVGPRSKVIPPPIHPFTLNVQRIHLNHNAHYVYADGTKEDASGPALNTVVSGVTYSPAPDWSKLQARALDNFNDKVRGDLDVAVDIAEWHQTKRMFSASEQIYDYTKTFARKFGVIKVASKAWLTYQYGLRPLASTLYGAADELIRVVINKRSKVVGRASERYFPKTCAISTIFGAGSTGILSSNIKVSCTYGVELAIPDWDPARWATLNPVSLAWELLPFSFVADWVYNVGGYLRNLETYFLYRERFCGGYFTKLSVGTAQLLASDIDITPPDTHWSYWTGDVRHVDINRTVLTEYPVPSPPSFRVNMGSSRLLTTAALLGNLLKGGGNPHRLDKRLMRDVQRNVDKAKPKEKIPLWPPGTLYL